MTIDDPEFLASLRASISSLKAETEAIRNRQIATLRNSLKTRE